MASQIALILLSQNTQASLILGRVTDESGEPIETAHVKIKGEDEEYLTDTQGYFSILDRSKKAMITAWKEGYYIGTASIKKPQIQLRRLPKDNPNYQFIHPSKHPDVSKRCINCHKKTVEVWEQHNHSKGIKNPVFLALKKAFEQDYPHSQGSCNSCHAPKSAQAVSCDVCHKINSFDAEKTGHGIDRYKLLRPPKGSELVIGPLKDVTRGHDTFSKVFKSSEQCAGCHSAKHHGKETYDTYTQWLDSPAKKTGKICQDCHMPHPQKKRPIAHGPSAIVRNPQSIRNHLDPTRSLDTRKKFIKMKLSTKLRGHQLDVKVSVTNLNDAHSFPSGSPFRNAFVNLSAFLEDGSLLKQSSGPTLPFSKKSGFLLARIFKPRFLIGQYKSGATRKYNSWGEFFWWPFSLKSDTRLFPGKTRTESFSFFIKKKTKVTIKAELIYQRYFKEMGEAYHLPNSSETIKSISQSI